MGAVGLADGAYVGALGSTVGVYEGASVGSGVGDAAVVNVTVRLDEAMEALALSVTLVPDTDNTVAPSRPLELEAVTVVVHGDATIDEATEDDVSVTTAEPVVVDTVVTTVWETA